MVNCSHNRREHGILYNSHLFARILLFTQSQPKQIETILDIAKILNLENCIHTHTWQQLPKFSKRKEKERKLENCIHTEERNLAFPPLICHFLSKSQHPIMNLYKFMFHYKYKR